MTAVSEPLYWQLFSVVVYCFGKALQALQITDLVPSSPVRLYRIDCVEERRATWAHGQLLRIDELATDSDGTSLYLLRHCEWPLR